MTIPLVILAVFAFGLGFLGTPAWPWFQHFLTGAHEAADLMSAVPLMVVSTLVVAAGIALARWLYGRKPIASAEAPDALEEMQPDLFSTLRAKFYVDEIYEATVIRLNAEWARACDLLDRLVLDTVVLALSYLVLGFSWLSRFFDEFVINLGFDQVCRRVSGGGGFLSRLQDGQVQTYLRVIAVALMALVLFLTWGCGQ